MKHYPNFSILGNLPATTCNPGGSFAQPWQCHSALDQPALTVRLGYMRIDNTTHNTGIQHSGFRVEGIDRRVDT